jgi:hypothetical protein
MPPVVPWTIHQYDANQHSTLFCHSLPANTDDDHYRHELMNMRESEHSCLCSVSSMLPSYRLSAKRDVTSAAPMTCAIVSPLA